MGENGHDRPPARKSVPTPYIDHDDAVVMIEPTALTRIACIDAALELGMRPIAASKDTAARVVTTVRPFVIIVEREADLRAADLTDLAVSVGAQLVFVDTLDVGPALAERVKLAGQAARTLRSRAINKP
jgi:hypothetical protein